MRILGINAVFHDPAAASSSTDRWWPPPRRNGSAAASTASRRCRSRRGNCPTGRAQWCLAEAGLEPADLDAVGYSYDPR